MIRFTNKVTQDSSNQVWYKDNSATVLATRTVSNPVRFTDYDPSHVCEYPRWSADESLIIYDSNRSGVYQMYAYRLADRTTARISSDPSSNSQFGSFENVPK